MKREFYINTGIHVILFPFKKWLKGVKYINVSKELVAREQYECSLVLLDSNKNTIKIPENNEILQICKLWDEVCFYDFLHNIVASVVLDNTDLDAVTVEINL